MNQKKASDTSKQNTVPRTRKETVLKAALCTLVCLWMFVLGVLVGRGTAPVRFDIERLQDKLAAMKTATVEKTTQRYRIAFQELDKEMDLGFHEALINKTPDLSSPVPSLDEPSASAASADTGAPAGKMTAGVPKKIKASEFHKPEKTGTAPAATTATPWVIQVAATQDKADGNRLVDRLNTMGFQAYLAEASVQDKGTWYRVRVGGYPSREAADTDLARLKQERFSPMIITP